MHHLGPRPTHTLSTALVGHESSLGSRQRLDELQEEDIKAQESEKGGAWGLALDGARLLPSIH